MSEILKKWIGVSQIDETLIRLNNNASMRGRNQANSADVNLLYIGTDNNLHLQTNVVFDTQFASQNILISGSTSGAITMKTGSTVTSYNISWPTAQATGAGQTISNDSAGNLTWVTFMNNPMTTLGDTTYGGSAGAVTRLAGDTSNTRKFLRELSVTGVATAPVWDTLVAGDIPSLTATYATVTLNNLGTTAVNAAIVPASNGAISLGASSLRWQNLYLNNAIFDGNGNAAISTANKTLTDNGNQISINWTSRVLNDTAGASQMTWGTTGVVITNALLPTNDNAIDVGSSSKRWANMRTVNDVWYGSTSGTITHTPAATTTSYALTWPAAQGTGALTNNGSGVLSWAPSSGGTVTSVSQADGSTTPIFTYSGSPITSSGTLTQTLASQAQNSIFAGPTSGSGQPGFRALVIADIPNLSSLSGSKNYLTTYIASTSSGVPNTGNGNFELGSTTGWTLGTIGTLTNGLPTGSPTFGSGASGNLSISTVSSRQLAGSYSLSYASSSATTQGNMLASDAFYIDTEDQAKVLTWEFYYKAQTNPSNADWSGTSSNSFGVAVYDVTNSTWLGTTASFGMTQSSGVGYATGTFQTATTTTQLRFVVYNVNATSGAITLYFDDFVVGPQTAPIGAPMTDWVNAGVNTITGSTSNPTKGTTTVDNLWWRRVGGNAEIRIEYKQTAAGTAGSGDYLFAIPSNLVIDTTKVTAFSTVVGFNAQASNPNVVGVAWVSSSATPSNGTGVVYVSDSTHVKIADIPVTTANLAGTEVLGSAGARNLAGTTVSYAVVFTVPISGWSSNVQMSGDTDTRVVSLNTNKSAGSVTANTNIPTWTNVVKDTHGAFNASTGVYTVPVTGDYFVAFTLATVTTSDPGQIVKNGSVFAVGVRGTTTVSGSCQAIVPCVAGDTLSVQSTQSLTVSTSTTGTMLSIYRLSGPSVIAATESVNARYYASSTSISGSLTTVSWSTKDFDSHDKMSSGTYTIPVSGKYQVNTSLAISGTFALNGTVDLQIQKNGTVVSEDNAIAGGAETSMTANCSDIISCLAGDTIRVQVSTSATGPAIVSSNSKNFFSIARVGN